MNKVQLYGKYQAIFNTSIDYATIEEQAFKLGSGVGVFMEKNGTIKIQLHNPRHSPILIFPNGKVQITVISEEEEAEVLDQLGSVLVALEGGELHFKEVKRVCSLKDAWPIYQRMKRGERARSGYGIRVSRIESHLMTNYRTHSQAWKPLPGKPILLLLSAGDSVSMSSDIVSR